MKIITNQFFSIFKSIARFFFKIRLAIKLAIKNIYQFIASWSFWYHRFWYSYSLKILFLIIFSLGSLYLIYLTKKEGLQGILMIPLVFVFILLWGTLSDLKDIHLLDFIVISFIGIVLICAILLAGLSFVSGLIFIFSP